MLWYIFYDHQRWSVILYLFIHLLFCSVVHIEDQIVLECQYCYPLCLKFCPAYLKNTCFVLFSKALWILVFLECKRGKVLLTVLLKVTPCLLIHVLVCFAHKDEIFLECQQGEITISGIEWKCFDSKLVCCLSRGRLQNCLIYMSNKKTIKTYTSVLRTTRDFLEIGLLWPWSKISFNGKNGKNDRRFIISFWENNVFFWWTGQCLVNVLIVFTWITCWMCSRCGISVHTAIILSLNFVFFRRFLWILVFARLVGRTSGCYGQKSNDWYHIVQTWKHEPSPKYMFTQQEDLSFIVISGSTLQFGINVFHTKASVISVRCV